MMGINFVVCISPTREELDGPKFASVRPQRESQNNQVPLTWDLNPTLVRNFGLLWEFVSRNSYRFSALCLYMLSSICIRYLRVNCLVVRNVHNFTQKQIFAQRVMRGA